MDGNIQFHPLDKLIGNHTFSFLEVMVPFVDYPFKKILVLFIKYQELMSIFHALDDRDFVEQCGFHCHPSSPEDMITDICRFLPGNYADSIRQMRQMMQMMEVMNMTSASDHGAQGNTSFDQKSNMPDISHLFQAMSQSGKTADEHEAPKNKESSADESSLYDSVLSILNDSESYSTPDSEIM